MRCDSVKKVWDSADAAMMTYLERNPEPGNLRLRLTLEELTEYGGDDPVGELDAVIEGWIGSQV
jgi:hypothetical protein